MRTLLPPTPAIWGKARPGFKKAGRVWSWIAPVDSHVGGLGPSYILGDFRCETMNSEAYISAVTVGLHVRLY